MYNFRGRFHIRLVCLFLIQLFSLLQDYLKSDSCVDEPLLSKTFTLDGHTAFSSPLKSLKNKIRHLFLVTAMLFKAYLHVQFQGTISHFACVLFLIQLFSLL
jgi:hypothetical protein